MKVPSAKPKVRKVNSITKEIHIFLLYSLFCYYFCKKNNERKSSFTESECVAKLMEMYQELINKE